MTGLEPATSWSQTKRSKPTELHPDDGKTIAVDQKRFKRYTNNTMKNSKGFTVVELLVVIAIVGVLVAILFVALDPEQRLQEARDAAPEIESTKEPVE